MAQVVCPTLEDILSKDQCLENFAGLGTNVYIGLKEDLESEMKMTDGEYSTPVFKAGKGLYKVQAKEDTVGIKGTSNNRRKGFTQEASFSVEAVDKATAKFARAVNNLDAFYIFEDSDVSQIMYHPQHKVIADSNGISSDTGQKADDDRLISFTLKNTHATYPNEFVATPEGGWDSLLASKSE